MRRQARGLFGSCIACLIAWSCSGPTPAAPSATGASGGSSALVSATTPVTTTWSCLTASRAGIFASGVSGCATSNAGVLRAPAAVNAPGAPTDLAATVSATTVTLTWLAPTSVDPVTSYVVEAGAFTGASNLALFDTGNTNTSLVVTGVPAGTYFVRVRGRNSAG